MDDNQTKSSESLLSISNFDLNTDKRKEKLGIALKNREENKIVLQERLNEKEEILNYLMRNFWDSMEVHDCTLVSFNSKNQIKNFSMRRIDKPEKMDDFSTELFNIPLSNTPTESNMDFEGQSISFMTSRKFSQDYIYLERENEIVFTGSTSFLWIKNDLPPNQLTKITIEPFVHDFINCRENRLKVI